MDRKWSYLSLVAVLVFVLPAVLLKVLPENEMAEPTDIESTQEGTQLPEQKDLTIRVLMEDDTVREMVMDEYLTGVLLQEMPASFEEEALKAQAVVARTYALRRNTTGNKHKDGAICTKASCCQGYRDPTTYISGGGTAENLEKMRQAVEQTGNQVLTYNGKLIEATYFSCSGGKTEDAQSVWGSDVPYLQAVDSPGEEAAAHFTDTVKFTAAEFKNRLGVELTGQPGEWIKRVSYTDGDGIDKITIGDRSYSGTELRKLLGLRSTAFVITAAGDSVIITTKGFGHRVGMSQYGADAMAVLGSTYDQILAHYYQGTTLETWE